MVELYRITLILITLIYATQSISQSMSLDGAYLLPLCESPWLHCSSGTPNLHLAYHKRHRRQVDSSSHDHMLIIHRKFLIRHHHRQRMVASVPTNYYQSKKTLLVRLYRWQQQQKDIVIEGEIFLA